MKIIFIAVFCFFLSACAVDPEGTITSSDRPVIKLLMESRDLTEKQVTCLIKKTKPLLEEGEWEKYVDKANRVISMNDPENPGEPCEKTFWFVCTNRYDPAWILASFTEKCKLPGPLM